MPWAYRVRCSGRSDLLGSCQWLSGATGRPLLSLIWSRPGYWGRPSSVLTPARRRSIVLQSALERSYNECQEGRGGGKTNRAGARRVGRLFRIEEMDHRVEETEWVKHAPLERLADTVDQFCSRIGISRRHFYELLHRGEGPATVTLGRRRLIRREAGETWLRERESETPKTNKGRSGDQ